MSVMAKLIKAVHVRDPERHRTVLLLPGEEPEPRLAALVTNPDAWEDGELSEAAQDTADGSGPADAKDDGASDGDDADPTKAAPAKKTAAKKTAATKPARGRDAADVGDISGE